MDLDEIRAVEEELLTSATRRDPARVRELLHPDFIEIGRSGTRWSRDDIVAALEVEGERERAVTDEWELLDLGADIALVAYVIRGPVQDSRHSSIWTSKGGEPRMLFHQGTFVTTQ
ncbi:nuclear transport factor 2 family protein [Microbacterium sp. CCNWLW134]|uniref:nuclear transport factor 2 family protein n=1 Tax=Microbacterium sp. CCNWLW134 TaxID=3122064 RepID=UPI00300FEB3A